MEEPEGRWRTVDQSNGPRKAHITVARRSRERDIGNRGEVHGGVGEHTTPRCSANIPEK